MRREWSVDAHPAWLVFEAEQQLQIRPQQYWIARHLMGHFGDIVQLNMGAPRRAAQRQQLRQGRRRARPEAGAGLLCAAGLSSSPPSSRLPHRPLRARSTHPHPRPRPPAGEGKTRVILPMLILHFANGRDLVRAKLCAECCVL